MGGILLIVTRVVLLFAKPIFCIYGYTIWYYWAIRQKL